ncbi:hypothetical protein EDB83DRAFT_2383420 [Lactarius deliciosus]|nr:hypothetical protein EDB83DRAFT_2383420 [Lactarius deliciosus]
MSIHLLALHLSLSQWPLAEVTAVVEVNTHTAHMVTHVEWLLEHVSCAICTSSDCVISLRLCSRIVQSDEWGGRRDSRRCRSMYA